MNHPFLKLIKANIQETELAEAFEGLYERLTPNEQVGVRIAATESEAPFVYDQATRLIADFEGFSPTYYLSDPNDPRSGTYGHGFEYRTDGTRVQPGDTITETESLARLREEVIKLNDRLLKEIPDAIHLPTYCYIALISFAFNVGTYFYGANGFNTISKALENKLWDQVPEALMLYVNQGTAVEAGLIKRRNKEASLWLKGLKTQ